MMETSMVRTWINEVTQAHLRDAPQPLKVWMLDELINLLTGHGNKSVNGIV